MNVVHVQNRRTHRLAAYALVLAIAMLIWPTTADLLSVAFGHRDLVRAAGIEATCLGVVLLPAMIAERRIRRAPDRWKGRGLLLAVAIICALQFSMYSIAVVSIILER